MEGVDLQIVTNVGLMGFVVKLSESIYGDTLIVQSESTAASQHNSKK